jgi:hypothetical protein
VLSPAALLVRAVLPKGGLVVTWSAYFDESGTDDGCDVFTLGGYVFTDEQFTAIDGKWKGMLESHRDSKGNQLPYFHMASCAHNAKVFKDFSSDQCDQIAREAIGLIVDHMEMGFAVSIEKKFEHLIPTHDIYTSPYTFACWNCLMSVRRWADERNYHGPVVYFFEQGHDSQAEADRIMSEIMSKPELKKVYRAAGHGFYDKREVRPLQCADVLAWQFFTHIKKSRKAGIYDLRNVSVPARKDFAALLAKKEKYIFQTYDEPQINALAGEELDKSVDEAMKKYPL